MIEEIIRVLRKHLKLSEEDAIIAALFAIGGFTADSVFFAGGIPPGTVTVLSGLTGLLGSRLVKNRRFYQNFLLGRIDELVSRGHLSVEDGELYKEKLIRSWMKNVFSSREDQDEEDQSPNDALKKLS